MYLFYGVLRVLKMTSMAKFNEITKHAKVRDLSLRIPLRILGAYSNVILNTSFETVLKNLEIIIDDSHETYNKRRQAAITNRLLEVILIVKYKSY